MSVRVNRHQKVGMSERVDYNFGSLPVALISARPITIRIWYVIISVKSVYLRVCVSVRFKII